ncbi:hypothetical protein N0V86_009807 [Didymella sp. IMI 355093]|nr:hypothetical protein N0V86_009807 [Didymella sp. IMI 355093]
MRLISADLMVLYVAQCDGTVGGPLNNDTVPYPLRDWAPKAPQHLSQSPAASSSATTKSEIKSVETLTGIASLTTKAPESTTISANGSEATVFDHTTSASSQATGTMSLAPTIQGKSRTALNVAAIVGVAIGGAVLLALIVGLVAWILRHRRRNKLPIAVSPPNYEPADSKEGYDKPELDGQTVCLATDTSVLDGVCADNIKGMCELDGGVASFFRVYTACLSRECLLTFDRQHLVAIFRWYSGWALNISESEARCFGEWREYVYDRRSTTSQASSTIAQLVTLFVTVLSPTTSDVESTSIRIESTVGSNSEVSAEPPSTTQTSAITPADGTTSIQDNDFSSASQTMTSSISRSSTSSLPLAQDESKPALSTSAIAGVAVGSILSLALIGGIAFFLLSRRKRNSRPSSPPVYALDSGKMPREKAGLDEPYSGVGVGGPVGFAELDGASPVNPVMEPLVYLSASQRQARVAQNF